MRIDKVLFGQAIRFIDDIREEKIPFSPFEVTRAIQSRYGFLEAPTKLADYNYQTGVTFLVGRFEQSIIRRFQIYQLGLLCEGEATTDVCDAFLDDIIKFLETQFAQRGREKPNTRSYVSHLEVHSEINLGMVFPQLSPVGQSLWETFKSYGYEPMMFEPAGLKFQTDATQLRGGVNPFGEFLFERRAEKPFVANIYFSAAPLRTSDHVKILEGLETALSKR
jgi:hypothetical protein